MINLSWCQVPMMYSQWVVQQYLHGGLYIISWTVYFLGDHIQAQRCIYWPWHLHDTSEWHGQIHWEHRELEPIADKWMSVNLGVYVIREVVEVESDMDKWPLTIMMHWSILSLINNYGKVDTWKPRLCKITTWLKVQLFYSCKWWCKWHSIAKLRRMRFTS